MGTGLAGAWCSRRPRRVVYDVHAVTFHDAPRRAHSVAAQGGITACARKVTATALGRLVTDTVKGGDFRGREAEAFRLGEESA